MCFQAKCCFLHCWWFVCNLAKWLGLSENCSIDFHSIKRYFCRTMEWFNSREITSICPCQIGGFRWCLVVFITNPIRTQIYVHRSIIMVGTQLWLPCVLSPVMRQWNTVVRIKCSCRHFIYSVTFCFFPYCVPRLQSEMAEIILLTLSFWPIFF